MIQSPSRIIAIPTPHLNYLNSKDNYLGDIFWVLKTFFDLESNLTSKEEVKIKLSNEQGREVIPKNDS